MDDPIPYPIFFCRAISPEEAAELWDSAPREELIAGLVHFALKKWGWDWADPESLSLIVYYITRALYHSPYDPNRGNLGSYLRKLHQRARSLFYRQGRKQQRYVPIDDTDIATDIWGDMV